MGLFANQLARDFCLVLLDIFSIPNLPRGGLDSIYGSRSGQDFNFKRILLGGKCPKEEKDRKMGQFKVNVTLCRIRR